MAINFSPLATEPFGRRPESARLDFEVAAPAPDALNSAITAASEAAATNGLVVEVAEVLDRHRLRRGRRRSGYGRDRGVRIRRVRLAPLLGVTLGDVVGASSDPFFTSLSEGDGCTASKAASTIPPDGGLGLTVPIFDPSLPAEVEVHAAIQVVLGNPWQRPGLRATEAACKEQCHAEYCVKALLP